MKIVKGASGFGDTIYMRVIMEWLLKKRPEKYIILTRHPEVFTDLSIETRSLSAKEQINYNCTYIHSKKGELTQFQDLVKRGGLPEIEFTSFLKNRMPSGKTLIIPPYDPMGGVKTSRTMMPNKEEFDNFTKLYANTEYIKGQYKFLDLVEKFNSANLVIGQVGWAVPLAQMLDVPLIVIFTNRALNSPTSFVSTIKPHKIIEKPTTFVKIME